LGSCDDGSHHDIARSTRDAIRSIADLPPHGMHFAAAINELHLTRADSGTYTPKKQS